MATNPRYAEMATNHVTHFVHGEIFFMDIVHGQRYWVCCFYRTDRVSFDTGEATAQHNNINHFNYTYFLGVPHRIRLVFIFRLIRIDFPCGPISRILIIGFNLQIIRFDRSVPATMYHNLQRRISGSFVELTSYLRGRLIEEHHFGLPQQVYGDGQSFAFADR